MKPSLNRLNILGILFTLAVIIFLIFANGISTPFQSDDERHIYISPLVKDLSNFTNLSQIHNRHINGLSFALNYKLGQENPFGYHLFNILIHIVSTALVFFITLLTTWKGTSWGKDAAKNIALITALLFGLHPIQTETVTYISGRPGGLAGLFYFASLLLFILASFKDCKIPRAMLIYILSITSHIPHLIAYNIVNTSLNIQDQKESTIVKYSAGGLRDFTRIAASNPIMWRDIFIQNKKNTSKMIDQFIKNLEDLKKAIENEDGKKLEQIFTKTKKIRKDIVEAGQDVEKPDFGRKS